MEKKNIYKNQEEINKRIANEMIKNMHIDVTTGSDRRSDDRIFNELKKDHLQNKKIARLVKECEEFGKQSFSLYRKGYESDIPSMDFSLFIKELISLMDVETLILFLEYYSRTNFETIYYYGSSDVDREIKRFGQSILEKSGLGIVDTEFSINQLMKNDTAQKILKEKMTSIEYNHLLSLEENKNESSHKQTIYNILSLNIDQYFISEKDMYLDFKTFLSLNYNSNTIERRFVWTNQASNHVLYYSLGIYNYNKGPMIKQLVDKYNFWLKWTKEAHSWYEEQQFIQEDTLSFNIYQSETDFYEKIKSLGLGERVYLLYDYARQTSMGEWEGDSYYATRCFGINEKNCLNKLKSIGILEESKNLKYVATKLTKQELLDKATTSGIDLKKSWTKDKMYEYLIQTQEGVNILNGYLNQIELVHLNKKYESDMFNLLNHIENNIPIIQLLCLIQ